MKKKTFILIALTLMGGGVFAQLAPGAGGTLESLLPSTVKVNIESTQKQAKEKNLVVVGSKSNGYKAFFAANDGIHGEELWVTNGTAAGTYMVKDINPKTTGFGNPASSNVNWMARFNDKVVFAADDGTNGMELWISDGTEAGTYMVKLIHDFYEGSYPRGFTQVNETQFVFQARDIDSEQLTTSDGTLKQAWLWVSDGTEAGTQRIMECDTKWPGQDGYTYHHHWLRVGKKVFFKADDINGNTGGELWITDGTRAGTRLVKDINWEETNAGFGDGKTRDSAIDHMVNLDDKKLVFKAWTPNHGNEPWASDGTEEGTYMIMDTNPTVAQDGRGNGGNFTEVGQFPYNGKVYGRGYKNSSAGLSLQGTTQLGSTNGEPGNFKIFDININTAQTTPDDRINSWPDPGVTFDGYYLFCAQSGMNPASGVSATNHGGELHYTNGETAWLQSDYVPGTGCNWVKELTVANGSVYWWTENSEPALGGGQKLHRLDYVVPDVVNVPGSWPARVTDFDPTSDQIYSLRSLGSKLIFARGGSVQGLYSYTYQKTGFNPGLGVDMGITDVDWASLGPVGIKEISASKTGIAIYPNPTTDIFRYNLEGETLNVKIYDMSGRLLKTEIQPTNKTVNVSSLPKGAYKVLITGVNQTYMSTLIIK